MAQAEAIEKKSDHLQSQGHFSKAKVHSIKSLRIYRSIKDRIGEVRVCISLGHIERQLENFDPAFAWYDQAQRKSSKELLDLALDAACGKALCWRGKGEFAKAAQWFRDLSLVYRKNRDKEGEAYLLWALGTTQRFLGQFKEAEKNLRKSVSLYKSLGDMNGWAYAICGLGGTLRMKGKAVQSGQCYKKAYALFKKFGDKFGLAYSSCGQGNAFRLQRKNKLAIQFFKKAINQYKALGQKGPLGFVAWSLVQLQISLGQMEKAKKNLKLVQKLFHSVKDNRGLVYVDLGWAEYFNKLDQKKAVAYYRRAYKNAKKQDLAFEMVHAIRRFPGTNPETHYKSLGVHLPLFRKYPSLP